MICQKLECFSNQQQNGGHVGGHFGSHFGGQFIKKRQTPFLTRHCKYVTHVSIKYILCLASSGLVRKRGSNNRAKLVPLFSSNGE